MNRYVLLSCAFLSLGCPRLPPVSGCEPGVQVCIRDQPHVCSESQRWEPVGDLACGAVQGVCHLVEGAAWCGPLAMDGGLDQ